MLFSGVTVLERINAENPERKYRAMETSKLNSAGRIRC